MVDFILAMVATSGFNSVWARMAKRPLELAVQAAKPLVADPHLKRGVKASATE
jgi:hypothetical protein